MQFILSVFFSTVTAIKKENKNNRSTGQMSIKHFLISILVFLQGVAWASSPKEKLYNEQDDWKKLQQRLPESYRLTTENLPQES